MAAKSWTGHTYVIWYHMPTTQKVCWCVLHPKMPLLPFGNCPHPQRGQEVRKIHSFFHFFLSPISCPCEKMEKGGCWQIKTWLNDHMVQISPFRWLCASAVICADSYLYFPVWWRAGLAVCAVGHTLTLCGQQHDVMTLRVPAAETQSLHCCCWPE